MKSDQETASDAEGEPRLKIDKTVMFADIIKATDDHGNLVDMANKWSPRDRIIAPENESRTFMAIQNHASGSS